MLKYKTQNIISIIGLAIGFTCFAFSALWIRYEMGYDSFHPKADRIYRVHTDLFKWTQGQSSAIQEVNPYQLAPWLKTYFPEIEDACGIRSYKFDEKISGLLADLSFCRMFDLPVSEQIFMEGRTDRPVVVTDELKGYVQHIKEEYKCEVQSIIPGWAPNTNIPFNMILPITSFDAQEAENWRFYGNYHIYALIGNGVDVSSLEAKLDSVMFPSWPYPVSVILTPITDLRHHNPSGNMESNIKLSHIQIFAVAGMLVILCSLLNHLTLFTMRVRIRFREMAMRKVNGATDWQIATTLYFDFLLIILLSLATGFILIAQLMPAFKDYATIVSNNVSIYTELFVYAALLIVCSVIVGGLLILYFRSQTLVVNIKGSGTPESRNMFRKGSLFIQLLISLGMMFCAVVLIKQIHFLHQTDLGINRHNVAGVEAECCPLTSPYYAQKIKQIPGINDALPIFLGNRFLSNMLTGSSPFTYQKDGETLTTWISGGCADNHFFDFFGIEIIEGTTYPNEFHEEMEVFNEAALKEVGDALKLSGRVVGVVRDFYLTPTTKAKPAKIYFPPSGYNYFSAVAYRYDEGLRQQTQQAVTQWFRNEFPDQRKEFEINFVYMEDIFEKHFKSERALLKLLSVMTLASILIAIFGVYSLTNLTCRQRRKEIAIRKINGATAGDILAMFAKEYFLLLIIGAAIAFTTGYFIMQRWLEQYVKQTSIPAWIYLSIVLVLAMIIALCVGWQVYRASVENPAEVVKSE